MDLPTVLHPHDLRVTRPRQGVWDVLQGVDRHLSAAEIADQVRNQDPGVNVSSVYRTLTLFGELGIVRESNLGDGSGSQWELTHADTVIHIVCNSCNNVEHHTAEVIEDLRRHLVSAGFEPAEIDVRVTGRCPKCSGGIDREGPGCGEEA